MRFLILDGVCHGDGWGIVSICMDCFKYALDHASKGSITALKRANKTCAGCGEPINTLINARKGHWNACSNRCYQREYRRRRRGIQSVIQWKAESRPSRCEACKQPIKTSRRDARFCSSRCRQWHYRQRRRAGAAPQ
jgi:hypothetical protein